MSPPSLCTMPPEIYLKIASHWENPDLLDCTHHPSVLPSCIWDRKLLLNVSSVCRTLRSAYHGLLWETVDALSNQHGSDGARVNKRLAAQSEAIVRNPSLGSLVRDADASYIFPLFAKALRLIPNVRTIRISWDLTIQSCSLLGESFRGISLSSVQSFAVPAMFIRWGSSFPGSMRLTTSPSYNLLKGMSLEKVDSLHMSLSPHCIRTLIPKFPQISELGLLSISQHTTPDHVACLRNLTRLRILRVKVCIGSSLSDPSVRKIIGVLAKILAAVEFHGDIRYRERACSRPPDLHTEATESLLEYGFAMPSPEFCLLPSPKKGCLPTEWHT
ncbi:hypothetical protein ARMGADRAFT_1084398 [Armillaria gallica]|uniref:F-box domain-containing protein n=1 Tax=Armillaria gallica TaxID=47427 RepID=A0A2H3D0N2_ARMGA|nr:hypothetical protein ARMGADRAFT_1084398 [Armillaria gallica]